MNIPCITNGADFALAAIIFGLIDIGIIALSMMFCGIFEKEVAWLYSTLKTTIAAARRGGKVKR